MQSQSSLKLCDEFPHKKLLQTSGETNWHLRPITTHEKIIFKSGNSFHKSNRRKSSQCLDIFAETGVWPAPHAPPCPPLNPSPIHEGLHACQVGSGYFKQEGGKKGPSLDVVVLSGLASSKRCRYFAAEKQVVLLAPFLGTLFLKIRLSFQNSYLTLKFVNEHCI